MPASLISTRENMKYMFASSTPLAALPPATLSTAHPLRRHPTKTQVLRLQCTAAPSTFFTGSWLES